MKEVDLQEVMDSEDSTPANINMSSAFNKVEVELEVRVGTTTLTFGELKALTKGKSITLDQEVNEPVDLVLKGSVVARGKLTVVDDNFGIEIIELPQ